MLPAPPRGRTDGPNVLVIVLDDLGFAQLGCFGSDIATPNIDALAADGLRYNRFHVTALCSPTRAAILTGRNHHTVGMGMLPELAVRYEGYNGRIPRSAATLARHLRDNGYSTYAVGKWHLAPRVEWSASGPFERWPLGLGFERFYGFLGGDTNQWTPELKADNHSIEPPRAPDEGYHLTEDLADQAIRMLQDQQQATPGKPFFTWFATGAMHAPHQVAGRVDRAVRRAGSTTVGMRGASACSRDRSTNGVVPAGYDVDASGRAGSGVGRAARRRATALRPHDGGVRRLPHAHRSPDRARRRAPARERPPRRHADLPAVRQRHQRRRWSARLGERAPLRARSRRGPRREPRPHRRPRRASVRTTTTPGAGRGPATRRCGCGSATRGSVVCARR